MHIVSKYNCGSIYDKQMEEGRLATLRSCNILDTPQEDCFDSIVNVMRTAFNMPIALITLLDENRLWFKAKAGTEIPEVPRNLSICSYTVLFNNVTIVPDLKKDPRFARQQMIDKEPHARFYAGAPIIIDGYRLGAVCILDVKPHHDFSKENAVKLAEYAAIASNLIMMRRKVNEESEKNSAKSEYLHNLGHELKTPMGVISGLSKILLASNDMPNDKKRLLKVMERSAESLEDLISSINDMSMIENRKFMLKKQRFGLRKLLNEIRAMMATLAESKSLSLDFDLKDVQGILLYNDRARLKQVFINLLTNAIKYTDSGKISVKAFNYAPDLDRPDFIEIHIRDTGIGISQEDMEQLFKRFSRTSRVSEREGTGLGLAISKQIIEQMGGKIGVNSTPGEGSTFWIAIPRKVVAQDT